MLRSKDLYKYDCSDPEQAKIVKERLLFYIAEASNLALSLGLVNVVRLFNFVHDALLEKIDEQLQEDVKAKNTQP